MGKIAILMVGVVLAASAQCIAACGVLPRDQSSARQTTPVEDCHHKTSSDQAPPADRDDASTCGHQLFVSESGPQAVSIHAELSMVALVAVNLAETVPEAPILADSASDWSPPSSPASTSRTILRV